MLSAADTLWGVWDRLTAYDGNMQPQLMLAESWAISTDYRQIKRNLRKGVQFHTGLELVAEDVRLTKNFSSMDQAYAWADKRWVRNLVPRLRLRSANGGQPC